MALIASAAMVTAIALEPGGLGGTSRSSIGPLSASPSGELVVAPADDAGALAAASIAGGDAVAIAPPPSTFDGPPAPADEPPPQLAPAPASAATQGTPTELVLSAGAEGGGVWALIVGVNDYPGTNGDLRGAVNDANDVDEALARYGVPAHQRLVLRDGQASAATIGAGIDWLVAHAGPSATAVVFFAGHARKVAAQREELVAADGLTLSDQAVAERLRPLRSARAWLTFATCFGGGFTEALAPGRILTAAADSDSLAWESSEWGRSYLVELMVRRAMIGGEAPESIQASFAFAADELAGASWAMPFQIDGGGGPLSLGARAPEGADAGASMMQDGPGLPDAAPSAGVSPLPAPQPQPSEEPRPQPSLAPPQPPPTSVLPPFELGGSATGPSTTGGAGPPPPAQEPQPQPGG